MSNKTKSTVCRDTLGMSFMLGGLGMAVIGSQGALSARTIGSVSGQGSDLSGFYLHSAALSAPIIGAAPQMNALLIIVGMLLTLFGFAIHALIVLQGERPVAVRACKRCTAAKIGTEKKTGTGTKSPVRKSKRTDIIWIERTFRF